MLSQPTLPSYPITDTLTVRTAPTILIVEDDHSLRDLLCSVLSEEYPGFRLLGASTGEQALAIAMPARPRLMLLDYHLASNMNGIELFDAIHSHEKRSIPTIMLSGDAPTTDLETRHISLLEKPFDLDLLLDRINEVLTSTSLALVHDLVFIGDLHKYKAGTRSKNKHKTEK